MPSSPYWNPQDPYQAGPPPQSGGWSYGGPLPAQPAPPPPPPPPPARPAGFGIRLVARAIDAVLATIAAFSFFVVMVLFTALATGGEGGTSDAEGALWGSLFLFGWGLLLFFYDWLYLIAWGRTLGKMMVGIKVVDAADGGKLNQGQAIGRSMLFCLPQSVPCLGHLFSLGESMAMFGDDRERALHDRVAGTVVIRTRD
ncbi:MAG TPA: RDD family protein [Nocardiopsis listeri]|uniref:RDD family protein n=1 Tax=Nocardiopsis listeri TaxID=53440 RepID=UPI001D21A698|nr:RDD family protein [Nocardiopsis listeri]HJE59353.1 RDD family protein [Nocardiopsis listeri]